jgi:EAL domain-containing protein (putative c-di-GMP-specific phosphodiesterase class I)
LDAERQRARRARRAEAQDGPSRVARGAPVSVAFRLEVVCLRSSRPTRGALSADPIASSHSIIEASITRVPLHVDRCMSFETEFEHAIHSGELELHYQPKLNLQTSLLSGAEALVRWRSPARGMILPTEFISLAEESGLIMPLGEWVFDEACRQVARWRDRDGLSIPIAVNLSPAQLCVPCPTEMIRTLLERYQLRPEVIEVEVTESAGLARSCAADNLCKLAQLGIRLAIDDFGSGYSNLNLLARLPLSTLKIDRSLISGLANPREAAIVNAIIDLTHVLGMKTVAEGVETPDQLAALYAAECDDVQGNLIAQPLEPTAFASWARTARHFTQGLHRPTAARTRH